MLMAEFIVVARLDQLPPGSGSSFTVAEKQTAIFNVDGIVYAMDDSCLHRGASPCNLE
jgi:nitrite reductase (NADH) small subunit